MIIAIVEALNPGIPIEISPNKTPSRNTIKCLKILFATLSQPYKIYYNKLIIKIKFKNYYFIKKNQWNIITNKL